MSHITPFFPENLEEYAPWVAIYGLRAPYGECQCGCGNGVSIARKTSTEWGYRKGAPRRYIHNHHEKPSAPRSLPSDEDAGTRKIALTQGLFVIVDASDYEWLTKWKWCTSSGRCYAQARRKGATVMMHRLILGAKKGEMIDHIDGNGLNNRRSNLRFCTYRGNNFNKRGEVNSTSKYKGVSWDSRQQRWIAQIGYDYKSKHLGMFDNEEDAARAHDKAARELHGEFARPNFKED